MAEVIGIIASALTFAQATIAVLDTLKKIKDAPKNIRDLQQELRDLEAVLKQISSTFKGENGETTIIVLQSCSDTLKELHDIVATVQREEEDNKLRQYIKVLRQRLKESDIDSAVKRLQSQKLTLTLALITSASRDRNIQVSNTVSTSGQPGSIPLDDKACSLLHSPDEDLNEESRIDSVNERKRDQFLTSLHTPDYQQDRVQVKDASDSTCEWLWLHPTYLSYQVSTEFGILHIVGKPGSGKSVLAKHVWKRFSEEIAETPANDSCLLLYYCCNKTIRPDETASSILRALIHQSLIQRPSLFGMAVAKNELMQSHSFSGKEADWNFDSLWLIFRAIVADSQLTKLYCIIDALDECERESMEDFLSRLCELLYTSTNATALRFLITSRPEGHIMDSLQGHTTNIIVDIGITRGDIEAYTFGRLSKLKKRMRLKPDNAESLQQLLVDRSEGMFLWVDLAIKDLEKSHGLSANNLADRVRSLPSGLNALYGRILQKIEQTCEGDSDILLARKILTWIALARRPLALAELRIAFAIEWDTKKLESLEPWENISYELLNMCGAFIEIDPSVEYIEVDPSVMLRGINRSVDIIELRETLESTTPMNKKSLSSDEYNTDKEYYDLNATVRLIHQSAKDYLFDTSKWDGPLSQFQLTASTGHLQITRTCLTYLLCEDFKKGAIYKLPVDSNEHDRHRFSTQFLTLERELANHRFLRYAALYWHIHAQESSITAGEYDVQTHTCQLLNHRFGQFRYWSQIVTWLRSSNVSDDVEFTGLHAAAGPLRLLQATRLLLDQGADIQARTTGNKTALHYAANHGNLDIVQLLLDRGAEIDQKSEDDWTALHFAILGGHSKMIHILVESGADPHAINSNGWGPLHIAAFLGYTEIANVLHDWTSDLEEITHEKFTALHLAALGGNEETVDGLLDRGADIAAKTCDGWTALHIAVSHGHLDVVETLLDRGAGMEEITNEKYTALHLAASGKYQDVINLLLERGADIEAKAKDNLTALHILAEHDDPDIVALLLDRGADIEANIKDMTPLYIAARRGNTRVVKALLDRNAMIEVPNTEKNALHIAVFSGQLEVVKLFLQCGADIEDKAQWQNARALHFATAQGDLDMVRLLLDQEANIEAKQTGDWTPLHIAVSFEHSDIIDLLLERGANTEAKDADEITALQLAVKKESPDIVRRILLQEVVVDARGEDDKTALHYAAGAGLAGIASLLLDKGADLEARCANGWTPLLYAANNGKSDLVALLISRGACINVKSKDRWTALNNSARNGLLQTVKLLLDNGADITVKGAYEWLSIHYAARHGHLEVVELLCERGVHIGAKDTFDRTAIHYAAQSGHHKVIAFLLSDHKKHLNITDNEIWHVLLLVIEKYHPNIVMQLLANLNIKAGGRACRQILHIVARGGYEPLVRLLVELKMDNISRDGEIGEALQLASIQGQLPVIDYLLRVGADPNIIDEHGWSPILCASISQRGAVVERLVAAGGDLDMLDPEMMLPPTSWSTIDKSTCLFLDDGATKVMHDKKAESDTITPAAVRSDHPIPLQAKGFYYEVLILDSGETGEIGIGLCPDFTRLDTMPGWTACSLGYHGDDGKIFRGSPTQTQRAETYGAGDVIGCHISSEKILTFIKNGISLGTFGPLSGKLYPVVGMRSRGACVRVNFGAQEYKYDINVCK